MCRKKKTHKASVTAKEKMSIKKGYCQEWDSNPCPFGPVPETGALDQLGHLDLLSLIQKKLNYGIVTSINFGDRQTSLKFKIRM